MKNLIFIFKLLLFPFLFLQRVFLPQSTDRRFQILDDKQSQNQCPSLRQQYRIPFFRLLSSLLFTILVLPLNLHAFKMESDSVILNDTGSNPTFTTVTFRQTYDTIPIVVATATSSGSAPSSLRVKNITVNGFDISQVEPENNDGRHSSMTIDYIAVEPGTHELPDGTKIDAGTLSTTTLQHGSGVSGSEGWNTINFSQTFSTAPTVLSLIQGMSNESNNPPAEASTPWLVTAIQNVNSSSMQIALERAEVNAGSVTNNETIGYIAIENNRQGTIGSIDYETQVTADHIQGWDNGCYSTSFNNTYTSTPKVIATQNRHDGGDGGWVRVCSKNNSDVEFTIDEDTYRDSERGHTAEAAGMVVFSEAFDFSSAPPNTCTGTHGLTGNYYNTDNFTGPIILSREDPTINFDWANSPGSGVNADNFTVRWTGTIYFPETADYIFSIKHDDAIKITIDGTVVYDYNYRDHNAWFNLPSKDYAAGTYPITIELVENSGGAKAQLRWINNATITTDEIVPNINYCTTSSTISADLALSETTAPSPSSANTNVDIDFFTHAENLGSDVAVGPITVTFTYSLDVTIMSVPTGLACSVTSGTLSAGSVNTCTVGTDLASGYSGDLQMTVQAEEGGTLTQTSTVSSTTPDPDLGNNNVTSSPVDVTLIVLLNAVDNDYTVNMDGTLTGNVITDNDATHGIDTGTGTLTILSYSDTTTEGSLTVNSDGSFTYNAPNTGYQGTQTFTYTITSSITGGTSQATVTIDVVINTDYETTLGFELINPENTRNVIGSYKIAGNTVLCLTGLTTGYATSESQCLDTTSPGTRTSNNFVAKYIDIDNDSSTWNSSSSNIRLDPAIYAQNGGNGILWAGLIWQGRFVWSGSRENLHYHVDNGASYTTVETGDDVSSPPAVTLTAANANAIRLKVDGGSYNPVQAHKVYSQSSSGGITYSAIANVTSILRDANLAPGDHTFTVANLPTEEGRENSPGVYGGWSLVVIYAEDTFNGSPRNISIYGGMDQLLGKTNAANVPIEISGFKLPSSGTSVTAQLSIFSGEGELPYTPDGVQISDRSNGGFVNMPTSSSQTNIFDAVMNDIDRDNVTGHMNNLQNNNVGIDVDNFDLSAIVSGYSRNITSMYLKWYSGNGDSSSDYIIPGMIAFSTELFRPSLCYDYTLDVGSYVIPSSDNIINTNLGAYTNKPLTTRVSIRSEEGDFVLNDVNVTYRIADVNQTSYISGTTAIAPDGVNQYIDVPTGQVYDETLVGFGLYIGEGAGIGQGGSIDSYETRYFKFDNDMISSSIDTSFSLAIQYTVNFGSGPVPQAAIFNADDICANNSGYYPASGRYNVASVNATPANDDNSLHGAPYNLYTQVADREFSVEVYSYDQDNLTQRKESNTTIEVEIFNAGLFGRDTNLTCNNPDSNVTEPVFVPFYNETWSTISGTYNVAMRNVGFRTWHLTSPDGGAADHRCSNKYDETCFQALYADVYAPEGNCATACTSGSSGCYPCLKTYYGNPICSRDNFSIRPDAFVTKLIDSNQSTNTAYTPAPVPLAHSRTPADGGLTNSSNVVAGYGYRYDVNATSFTSDSAVPKYIRIFNEDSSSTSTALMSWSPRSSATDCNSPDPLPINTILFDGTSIYGTSAVVGQVDQVGEYKFELTDQNWTSVDWDDSKLDHHVPPEFNAATVDDCIYDSNLTEAVGSNGVQGCEIANLHSNPLGREYRPLELRFYPYDFSLNLSLGAGPTLDRDFVYINTMLPNTSDYPNGVDENMSYNIQGTFTARGFGGIAVNNYVTNCYAEDINMRLLHTYLDTTLPLPSSETALRYNLVDINATDASEEIRPRENGVLTNLSTSETALIISQGEQYFKKEMQGAITMDLGFNFNRTNDNTPSLNPRRINFGDFNITDALGTNINVDMKSDHLIKGDLLTPNDANITFMYARAKPAQEFYDDVTTPSIITPISVVTYCDGTLSECINLGIPYDGVSDIQTNEVLWLKSIYHNNVSRSDGNIGITEADPNVGLSSNVVAINSGGVNNSVTVSRNSAPLPVTVPIELITDPTTANYTDRWLIYNEDNPLTAPSPFYRVRFINEEGWAGHGSTGHVVDGNVSSKKNRRLGW